MGGPNSNRWAIDYVPRDLVERCHQIALKEFYKLGLLKLRDRQVAEGTLVKMQTANRVLELALDGTNIDKPEC